jgi:chemotaxis response regulator CheB
VYVLPGHFKSSYQKRNVTNSKATYTEIINTAVDEFLFSLADDQKGKAIAIILSGTGKDGASGAKQVHENNGFVIVQDPASAEFVDMPLAAIRADHPEEILSPARLGEAFLYLLETKRYVPSANA